MSDDVQVISVDPVSRLVSFGIVAKRVSGISKLIQIVVLSLMNTPGRDALNPGKGGGLPSLVGTNIDPNDTNAVFADVAQRVRKSETEIVTDQLSTDDPPAEKLRELMIIALSSPEIDEIAVQIRIVNQLGQATDIVL